MLDYHIACSKTLYHPKSCSDQNLKFLYYMQKCVLTFNNAFIQDFVLFTDNCEIAILVEHEIL
jgi:hypothetical protein